MSQYLYVYVSPAHRACGRGRSDGAALPHFGGGGSKVRAMGWVFWNGLACMQL